MLKRIAKNLGATVTTGRRFGTFFECVLSSNKEQVKMDFALDLPGRQKPVQGLKAWGIQIDNRLDIACNKLSALYDRAEPKDFADIYFIHKSYLQLPRLINDARRKYPELNDYGLAMSFLKVKDISFWPSMLKAFQPEKVKGFFVAQAKLLAKDF